MDFSDLNIGLTYVILCRLCDFFRGTDPTQKEVYSIVWAHGSFHNLWLCRLVEIDPAVKEPGVKEVRGSPWKTSWIRAVPFASGLRRGGGDTDVILVKKPYSLEEGHLVEEPEGFLDREP